MQKWEYEVWRVLGLKEDVQMVMEVKYDVQIVMF